MTPDDLKFCRLAQTIAEEAHAGQRDKAGRPYIDHCRRVAARFPAGPAKAIAWLHDVVEDCPGFTLEKLAALGVPERVIEAVDALTKRPDEDYDDYLRRVIEDDDAHRVKIMDLIDNMDASRLAEVTDQDKARIHKYAGALGGLVVALDYKHHVEKDELMRAKVEKVLLSPIGAADDEPKGRLN